MSLNILVIHKLFLLSNLSLVPALPVTWGHTSVPSVLFAVTVTYITLLILTIVIFFLLWNICVTQHSHWGITSKLIFVKPREVGMIGCTHYKYILLYKSVHVNMYYYYYFPSYTFNHTDLSTQHLGVYVYPKY